MYDNCKSSGSVTFFGRKEIMKKYLSVLLSLGMAASLLTGCGNNPQPATPTATPAVETQSSEEHAFTTNIAEVNRWGNLVVDATADQFNDAGIEIGDILDVTIDGHEYTVPYVTTYFDVNLGEWFLLCSEDYGTQMNTLNAPYGLEDLGIILKETDDAKTYEFADGRPVTDAVVTYDLKEKGGYLEQLELRKLDRTNNREDYASDAEFANFRNVQFGDMGKNAYFRTASPINPKIGRAAYADKLTEAAHVNCIINLADNEGKIEKYLADEEKFDSPYYKSLLDEGNVILLHLGAQFMTEDFHKQLTKGFEFYATHEGPYLSHCTEGKDRCGFTSMVVESLMGATFDEMAEDYLQTYINYYHIEKGDAKYVNLYKNQFIPMLGIIQGVEGEEALRNADLVKGAEDYLLNGGMSEEQLNQLKENLSKDY